ncbi:MAG: hypothetical protein K6G48_02670 [Acholeplasmatales bacterium]|nr:hypothetical protein [Acholeplasmatales bacterium]
MKETYKDIYSKQFEQMFVHYFDDSKYIDVFCRQYYSMLKNVESIDALLKIQNYEDAFTIFRKYIETFILSYTVLKHPNISGRFLIHDKYLTLKSQGEMSYEDRQFYKGKPDGFLQYGFIEEYVDTTAEDFRYSIRTIAEASDIVSYYDWYRVSNNFVHNNTTNLNVEAKDAYSKIKEMILESSDKMIDFLKDIIKKMSVGIL